MKNRSCTNLHHPTVTYKKHHKIIEFKYIFKASYLLKTIIGKSYGQMNTTLP